MIDETTADLREVSSVAACGHQAVRPVLTTDVLAAAGPPGRCGKAG
jgi:hypothetical protein